MVGSEISRSVQNSALKNEFKEFISKVNKFLDENDVDRYVLYTGFLELRMFIARNFGKLEILLPHLYKLLESQGHWPLGQFQTIALSFVSEYLRTQNNIPYIGFDLLYLCLEKYLYHDSDSFRAFSVLENFESDLKLIELEDNLRITNMYKPFSAWDKFDYLKYLGVSYPEEMGFPHQNSQKLADGRIIWLNESILELCPIKVNKDREVWIPKRPNEKFEEVISQLRLYKNESIGIGQFGIKCTYIQSLDPWIPGQSASGSSFSGYRQIPRYRLDEEDQDKFIEFRKLVRPSEFRDELKAAMLLYNGSFGKNNYDRFIYYFMSLEALFTAKLHPKKSKPVELRKIVSALIASDDIEKKKIGRNIMTLYKIRGSILHKGERPDKIDKIGILKDYVRKSIVYTWILLQERFQNIDELRGQLRKGYSDENSLAEILEELVQIRTLCE